MSFQRAVDMVFDTSGYSIDALQRAAYRFADRLSIEIVQAEQNWVCRVFPIADELTDEDLSDFRTECLDQVLRERIRVETEGLRNLILAQAFSGLVERDAP